MKDITGDIEYFGVTIRFMNAEYYSKWQCSSPLQTYVDYQSGYLLIALLEFFIIVIFSVLMKRGVMQWLPIATLSALWKRSIWPSPVRHDLVCHVEDYLMHSTHKFDRITYHGCIERHDLRPMYVLLFILLGVLAIICIVYIARFSKKKLQAAKERTERDTLLYA